MHRLALAAMGLCLAAGGVYADGAVAAASVRPSAATKPAPQQSAQHRPAQEKLNKSSAAKKPAAQQVGQQRPAKEKHNKPPAETKPTPQQQLVQQRAAQEKLNRQARLAARKQPQSPPSRVFYPGAGLPAQPAVQRSVPNSPQRAVPSANHAPSAARPAAAASKPTPQELVQQRAAQELVHRQLRLAARWQSQLPQPLVFYPGAGMPAQPIRARIDYEFPFRAAQSLNGARYWR